MILNMLTIVSLAVACGWAQAPDGRWDGTITYVALRPKASLARGRQIRPSCEPRF
jgi:hypothetical protein